MSDRAVIIGCIIFLVVGFSVAIPWALREDQEHSPPVPATPSVPKESVPAAFVTPVRGQIQEVRFNGTGVDYIKLIDGLKLITLPPVRASDNGLVYRWAKFSNAGVSLMAAGPEDDLTRVVIMVELPGDDQSFLTNMGIGMVVLMRITPMWEDIAEWIKPNRAAAFSENMPKRLFGRHRVQLGGLKLSIPTLCIIITSPDPEE